LSAPNLSSNQQKTYGPGISIVVPVYNSESTLNNLVETVKVEMSLLEVDWEVILVDDGSIDSSWRRICALAEADTRVIGIRFAQNYGQHPALLAGIRLAKYAITVTIDDDLQHRPSSIRNLIAKIDTNVSLVYGVSIDEEHNAARNVSSRVSKWFLSRAVGMKQAANASAFRAFNTNLRESWNGVTDTRISIDVLLSWSTKDYQIVNVPMDKRAVGKSNYTFNKLLKHLFNMVLGFSTRPLTIITIAGCVLGLVGFLVLCWVLFMHFFGSSSVAGFTFLASLISLMGGMQLVCMGIIGQYLGRIYDRSMGKPIYQIKSSTSDLG